MLFGEVLTSINFLSRVLIVFGACLCPFLSAIDESFMIAFCCAALFAQIMFVPNATKMQMVERTEMAEKLFFFTLSLHRYGNESVNRADSNTKWSNSKPEFEIRLLIP